ncbi:MAG TPA: EAL domain-containing protein [bacterium]|nr:EAL domain-containing protein [bacterium]
MLPAHPSLESLLEQLPQAAALVDGELRLTSVNALAARLLGLSVAELAGLPLGSLLPPDDCARLDAARDNFYFFSQLQRRDEEWTAEFRLRRLGPGQGGGWLLLLQDVTASQQALAALRSNEERYRLMVEASPDGLAVLEDGLVVFANGSLERLLGLAGPEEIWGSELESFIHPDDTPAWTELLRAAPGGGPPARQELKLVRRDTGLADVEVELQNLGRPGERRLLLLARDIRARKTMERRIRESEERYKGLADVAFDGLAVHVDGVIVSVNRSFEAIFGLPAGGLLGADIFGLFNPDSVRLFRQEMDSGQVLELEGLHTGGGAVHVEASTRACLFQGDPAHVTALRDITRRRNTEEVVRRQAWYDALTGLPNRILFLDRLEHALSQARRSGRRLAVLFLDLDRFKLVNDSLGHAAGDQLLQQVAGRLQGLLRKSDTVARLGGDEFTVLLEDAALEADAMAVGRKLVALLSEPFTVMGQEVHIGTSVGAAFFPDHASDGERLIKLADMAMYRAKDSGRGQAVAYAETLEAPQEKRLDMENDLRRGIDQREFQLWYQPQVDLRNGKVIGAEALLRWQHPTRGLLSPAQFIPLAEESRLIVPLGEWVLQETCAQAAAWPSAALGLSVAVNLSAWQMHTQSLLKTVDAALASSGLDPRRLELEITESVAMRNAAQTLETLRAFAQRGVRLALDDFGQGYSSLVYLKDFPVQSIKLDQAFVAGLPGSEKDAAILRAVLGLCRSLHLQCLAEGVESAEQADFLRQEGCDLAQGFYFAHPMDLQSFRAMLEAGGTLP